MLRLSFMTWSCCAYGYLSCALLLSHELTSSSSLAEARPSSTQLTSRDLRLMRRLTSKVERALEPKGSRGTKAAKNARKVLPQLAQLEGLFARYLHHSSAAKQRGAALAARRLFLRALHAEEGLFELINGRLCLRPAHRANLAGLLIFSRAPLLAIEQLKRGASCAVASRSFWEAIHLIAQGASLPTIAEQSAQRLAAELHSAPPPPAHHLSREGHRR